MGILSKLFGVPTVPAAALGILDLSGGRDASLIAADRATLGPLFAEVKESTSRPPECTLLLIYCAFGPDGRIPGQALGLREITRDARAPIVIVASPNPGPHCVAAARSAPYGKANLVMLLDRKGDGFGRFFGALVRDMKRGTSMPAAWVKLAPQGGAGNPNNPEAVFACEVGQLALSEAPATVRA